MKEIKFYVGIGFDQKGEPIEPSNAAKHLETMQKTLCDYFGGYTEIRGQGGWKDATVQIIEPSIVFSCIVATPDRLTENVKNIAKQFAHLLDQKCVMVTIQDINCHFVTQ